MIIRNLLNAFLTIQTLLVCIILNAQVITPTYISVSDGVADPVVNRVIQDAYGYMWIATNNGLQKYDGYKFQTFRNDPKDSTSLKDNLCWSVFEDSKQNIWVSTNLGISRFNKKTNTFKNYGITSLGEIQYGIVFSMFEDSKGVIWTGTQMHGAMYYDELKDTWVEAKFEVGLNDNPRAINATCFVVAEDEQQRLWAGIQNVGLLMRKPNEDVFENINTTFEIPVDFSKLGHSISSLFVDSQNLLWITTRTGIYRLYPETGDFETIITYPDEDFIVWANWNCVREDEDGTVWVSNNYHGLLKFANGSDVLEEVKIDRISKINSYSWDLTLTTFSIDKSGIFWFGTRGKGIMKYDPVQKPFTTYTAQVGVPGRLNGNYIHGLYTSERDPSKIYVGLRDAGLDVFNEKTKQFTHIPIEGEGENFEGSARSIIETDEGTLLVGVWQNGLIELDKNYKEIRHLTRAKNNNGLADNNVRVLKKDKDGQIWIGTSNGLNRWNRKADTFKNFKSLSTRRYGHDLIQNVYNKLSASDTISILQVGDFAELSRTFEVSEQNDYLIATTGEGDTKILFDYGWIANEVGDTIWTAFDAEKSFWAGGAVKNRLRIDVVSLEQGKYTLHYNSDDSHSYGAFNETAPDDDQWWGITIVPTEDKSLRSQLSEVTTQTIGKSFLSDANITAIELTDSVAWIGTNSGGLNRINLNTNEVTFYQNDPSGENSISNNAIRVLCFDDQGFLWIGTDNGLNKFDTKANTFTIYNRESGLATNGISSIVDGDEDEMWIATTGGLSRMLRNPSIDKVTFINYYTSDGLSNDNFVTLAGLRSASGTYYFGSENGLNTFRPITGSQNPPDIVLSNFLISNVSVLGMGNASPVNLPLEVLSEMNLSYDENDLSFEFTALHYSNSSKNQYAHKLEGHDKDWSYDNRNFASYTNLEPGDYTFKIRAANASGVWNEEGKSISIHIASPWWRTWWAYGAYILIGLALIFISNRILQKRIANREREKNREKELAQAKEIEKAYHNLEVAHDDLKAAQDRLVQQEKLASLGQLTAGIAHEIKNPLNFVNNFSELSVELLDELNDEFEKGEFTGDSEEIKSHIADIKANLQKINQHGTRADGIVKSMLQHSRGGSGSMDPTDLNVLVTEFVNLAFHGMRAAKNPINVILDFDLDPNMGEVMLIADDFSRLVLNLSNNAFDAMREKTIADPEYKPRLIVKTERIGAEVGLSIADNGTGIPEEIKDKILQPFFTTKKGTDGTGLGLSITHDIVKAHGGELTIETKEKEGTEFIISLPNV